jgi:hypothetical protein
MSAIRLYLPAIAVGIVIAACGGSGSSVSDSADSGAGAGADSGGSADDAAGNADGTTASDTGSGADGTTPDGGSDSSFLGDSALTLDGNDGGGCPNVLGGYAPLVATGMGCGDFNSLAKQCVLPAPSSGSGANACLVRFNSEQPATIPAVNGPSGGVDIKTDGTFDNAALKLGTINRSGCVGSFNEGTQTMTVTCGGTGTSQSCTITLVRSSVTCP